MYALWQSMTTLLVWSRPLSQGLTVRPSRDAYRYITRMRIELRCYPRRWRAGRVASNARRETQPVYHCIRHPLVSVRARLYLLSPHRSFYSSTLAKFGTVWQLTWNPLRIGQCCDMVLVFNHQINSFVISFVICQLVQISSPRLCPLHSACLIAPIVLCIVTFGT